MEAITKAEEAKFNLEIIKVCGGEIIGFIFCAETAAKIWNRNTETKTDVDSNSLNLEGHC